MIRALSVIGTACKRFNVPFLGRKPISEMMAFEVRREGLDVSIGRLDTAPGAAPLP